ncbi:MAG: hypothetical protein R3B70_01675 [Polyangiaceae bacterium]
MMRLAPRFSIFLFLGVSLSALSGCGKNACEQADDDIANKYLTCDADTAGVGATNVECTDAAATERECRADCYEAASCDTLKGNDTAGSIELEDCLSKC